MGSLEPYQPEFVKLVFKKKPMKQLKGKCYEILDPRFIGIGIGIETLYGAHTYSTLEQKNQIS